MTVSESHAAGIGPGPPVTRISNPRSPYIIIGKEALWNKSAEKVRNNYFRARVMKS